MTLSFTISFTCEVDPTDYVPSTDETSEQELRASTIQEITDAISDPRFLLSFMERATDPITTLIQ